MRRFFYLALISLLLPQYFYSNVSLNTYGQIGYINSPSAFNLPEASVSMSLKRDYPNRNLNFTISPFSWVDFTVFYVDIVNKEYPGGFKQSYKDKGFNMKLTLKEKDKWPALAVGFNDIAGTGYFSSEYIVLSDYFEKFEYSLGIGWGTFDGGLSIRNPFTSIDEGFKKRSDATSDFGGTLDTNNYFSGKRASVFGAISYSIGPDLKLIAEIDPLNRNSRINYKKPSSRFNFGLVRQIKDLSFGVYSNRGSHLSLDVALTKNFSSFKPVKKFKSSDSPKTYSELRSVLAKNKIGLESVSSNKEDLHIVVNQNIFQNQYEVNEVVYKNLKKLKQNSQRVIISQKYLDMEVVKTFYPSNNLKNIRNETYDEIESENFITDFQIEKKFPIVLNKISPVIRNQLASREGFIHTGLLIEDNLEIIFSNNIILIGNFKYSLYDNFDDLYIDPLNTYPNQVRSDLKKYLNNFDSGIVLGRLELNAFQSFKNKHFLRFSAGIFEEMFGGVGLDYQYYPQGSFVSLGAETYFVKKRDYSLDFNFLNYKNTLSRVNVQAIEPRTKVKFKLSYGEYLAGDEGYTFDISRRFDNGVELGGFITRTNVTYEQFGEGSFDKGIKIKIPFSLFGGNSLSRYEWRPLTKDPGALLVKSVDISDQISRYRVY